MKCKPETENAARKVVGTALAVLSLLLYTYGLFSSAYLREFFLFFLVAVSILAPIFLVLLWLVGDLSFCDAKEVDTQE